ncbi:hypothetical protein D9M71_151570 [compost metagenome]
MQAQTLAQLQVDRNVRRRAAGEECGDAAFAQAGQHQRVWVAAQFPEYDERVHHQCHEQHAAQQYDQQVRVADQGAEARGGEGRGHQAEDAQRGKADYQTHDHGHAIGQIAQHFASGVSGVADGNAHADGPRQDADEIGVHQRTDRIVDHAQQQALQHFANPAWRCDRDVLGRQHQAGRERHAGNHRDHGRGESAQQIQEQNRADVGFLAVLVVGNRRHDQHEHQNRRDGFQCRDKHFADERRGFRHIGGNQRQGNTGDQADHNLCNQAQAFKAVQ